MLKTFDNFIYDNAIIVALLTIYHFYPYPSVRKGHETEENSGIANWEIGPPFLPMILLQLVLLAGRCFSPSLLQSFLLLDGHQCLFATQIPWASDSPDHWPFI